MALKNFTTKIRIEKTISEIESILARFGAKNIYKQYNDSGIPFGLAFQVIVNGVPLGFKLPMNEDKVLQVFKNENLQQRYLNIEQARRTGWRIIKDWIDSQVAMMEVELVELEQVFLPYLYDAKLDETLYERMKRRNFNLAISHNSEES